jgi:hypothetical protein
MARKFELGNVLITQEAKILDAVSVIFALCRHITGDWGEVCDADKKANNSALEYGERLLSAYYDVNQVKFWIITELDRSYTTILLPEEY